MDEPLGYFLTWRTYGTWRHGDPRGSVDWQHNVYLTPMLPPSRTRAEQARVRMHHPAMLLGDAAQRLVADVIDRHCRLRGWELFTSAVRSNHAHVVIGYCGLGPEPMMAQLKAYATRALRDARVTAAGVPVWAEGGSTRYLWTAEQLNGACAYVREGQDVPR